MTAPTRLLGEVDPHQYGDLIADVYEHIPDLTYPLSVQVYNEMRRDSRLTAILAGYGLQLRRAQWQLDGAGCRPEVVAFVADCLGLPIAGADEPGPARRRGVSWNNHLRSALLCQVWGHYCFEMAAEIDPDGRARLVTLAERVPSTIAAIRADGASGDLLGIDQNPLRTRQSVQIPADRLVFYSREREGNAWQGNSLLRPSYGPWLIKREMTRVAAISNRRWGAGVPVAEALPGTNPSPGQMAEAQRMASSARAGDQAGASVPPGFALKIVGLSGSVPDTLGFIRYLNQEMAQSVLMPHLDLGTTETGSRALGSAFIDSFNLALESEAEHIADTITRQCVVRLVDWNWGEDEPAPRVVVSGIGSRREVTAESLQLLLSSGALAADPALEAWVRREYRLPERDPRVTAPGLEPKPEAQREDPADESENDADERPTQVVASIDGGLVEAHLPGKHNQKDHARKRPSDVSTSKTSRKSHAAPTRVKPPAPPAVKVLTLGQVFTNGRRWQAERDLDKRAGNLWAESFTGLEAVRQAMRNIRAGRRWDEGVDTNADTFREHYMQVKNGDGSHAYTHDDMRADILSAALRLQARLDAGIVHQTPLFRGMRMDQGSVWKVGDSFSQDVASWTERRDYATVYANAQNETTGHVGDAAVIVSLLGRKRSADIDDLLPGAMRGSKEHIAGGTYRVMKVTQQGGYWLVEVTQSDA